jgi:hypothetical protein
MKSPGTELILFQGAALSFAYNAVDSLDLSQRHVSHGNPETVTQLGVVLSLN